MKPIITVKDLSKRYVLRHETQSPYTTLRDTISNQFNNLFKGKPSSSKEEFWALNGVNFEINQGDRVGIIGRNGAGKSTLLKILSRITEPTKGRITIQGRVASLLEVGTGFHPELSGRENIFLNGSILGMSYQEIKKKFDEIVAFAEVERFLDTPVKRYSSGMYVRLAFAVAAHLEPEILIVDEVLAVGDVEFQKKCFGKMREVTGEGRTVLFVSHNLSAIQNICNQVIFLKSGKVEFQGETELGLSHYIKSTGNISFELKDRLDRSGNGNVRFNSIHFQDENSNDTPSLQVGKSGYIVLNLSKFTSSEINNLKISIGIDNEYGQRVLLLSNDLRNQLINRLTSSSFYVKVKLEKVSIQPGQYSLTLFAAVGETIMDWIQEAGTLDVEAGDFYGSGKLAQNQGFFLAEHDFSIEQ